MIPFVVVLVAALVAPAAIYLFKRHSEPVSYDPLETEGLHTVTPDNIDHLLPMAADPAESGHGASGRGEPARPCLAPPPAPIDTTTQEHQ